MTSHKRSILIVEDERIVAKDLQQTLAGLGYDAFAIAATAEQALAIASERCPDLALMDIRIKGEVDGIEVARILRENFGIPVVFLTAHADGATLERAKKTQPYAYLLKPVKVPELRSAIEVSLFRHELEKELRERERRSASVLSSMADAVITVDPSGKITFMNAAAEAITGARAVEATGRAARDVFPVVAPLEAALAGKQSSEPTEATVLDQTSGERRVVSCSVAALASGAARLGAVMVFRDVTEQRKLEKQLDLSGRLASLATLAAGVAHHINNPLAVVMNNAVFVAEELARAAASGSEKRPELQGALEAISDLEAAAERIARVVSDLTELSRPSAPRDGDLTDPVLCLKSALRATADEFRGHAQVVTRLDPAPAVMVHEHRLREVFVHLLRNAARALPSQSEAGNQVTVVTSTDSDGHAVVEIHDNGAGIPKDALDRVFDPFFTTEHKQLGGGRGLGLSISRGIVASLGGEIEIQSEQGQGTEVWVRLPPAEPRASPTIAEPAQVAARRRILVVDDEPLVLRVLARLLREHELVCLESARTALSQIASGQKFDLVLSDVMMPDITGVEFYEALLRQDPALARRVVFISGGALSPEVDAFLRAIPNPLIQKPFGPDLRATIERLLLEGESAAPSS